MPRESQIHVLLVDGDKQRRAATIAALQGHDRFTLDVAESIAEAVPWMRRTQVDCLVTPIRLPDGGAVDLFRYAAGDENRVCRIIYDDRQQACLPEDLGLVYAAIDRERKDAGLPESGGRRIP